MGCFPSDFSIKTEVCSVRMYSIPRVHATFPAHVILRYLNTVML
jgi:hypothetical protein